MSKLVKQKHRPVLCFSFLTNAFVLASVSISVVESFTCSAGGYPKMQESILYATERQELETKNPCPLLPPVENVDEYAEFAMGWFWRPQRDFDRAEGIIDTVVGYSGSIDPGNNPNPTYKSMKGYAESIRIRYDRTKLTYSGVLDMFFTFHIPTSPRWSGSQYRSAIFCLSQDQRQVAEEMKKTWGNLGKFIAIEDSSDFYRGEKYHQKYMENS